MKTLLVLAQHPDLAETIRAGLNAEQYRVLHRAGVEEAEPLLAQGLADACIVDVELTSVQGVWFLEKYTCRNEGEMIVAESHYRRIDVGAQIPPEILIVGNVETPAVTKIAKQSR